MLVQSAEKIILVFKSRRHLFLSSFSLDKHPEHRVGRVLFLHSLELGLPQPLTRRRACPPPPTFGPGGGTLACRRGVGGVPNSQFRRGDIHCGALHTVYIEVLCDPEEDPQKYNSPSRIYIVHCKVRQHIGTQDFVIMATDRKYDGFQ